MILKEILLDDMPVDPSFYSINGSILNMTLTSEFGPFTKDLIIEFESVPESTSIFGILALGTLGTFSIFKRKF